MTSSTAANCSLALSRSSTWSAVCSPICLSTCSLSSKKLAESLSTFSRSRFVVALKLSSSCSSSSSLRRLSSSLNLLSSSHSTCNALTLSNAISARSCRSLAYLRRDSVRASAFWAAARTCSHSLASLLLSSCRVESRRSASSKSSFSQRRFCSASTSMSCFLSASRSSSQRSDRAMHSVRWSRMSFWFPAMEPLLDSCHVLTPSTEVSRAKIVFGLKGS
mmetsp:Transcript_2083/g.8113  ORF Transcript_2083/g.8113 Transcript_2083/m.8113 type:complete len:220 (+) Transcript_2083:1114-1773(+)